MTDGITELHQDKIDAAAAAHASCEECSDSAEDPSVLLSARVRKAEIEALSLAARIAAGVETKRGVPDSGQIAPETILEEAARITAGPRQRDYDHPLPNHERIVSGWRWYIKAKYGIDVPFDAEDGPYMMEIVKMSRDMHRGTRENLTDDTGYARCLERMRARRGEEGYAP